MGETPRVEQRRGDVGTPAVAQRHPRHQGDRGTDPGLAARCALGCARRAGGEDHDARVAVGGVEVGVVVRRDQRLDRVRGGDPRSSTQPRSRASTSASCEQAGELLVVDDDPRPLAIEDVDQLRAGERRVEQEDVGAALRGRDDRVDEAPVVAAHHRDAVALAHAVLGECPGQGVGAAVHLAEGQRAELVDQADPVGVTQRHRDEAARRAGPPLLDGLADAGEDRGGERAQDARSRRGPAPAYRPCRRDRAVRPTTG